jgi:6-phosphofructokinase 1
VLTSGGDAPGMNAAIRAVVRTACGRDMQVTGVRHGYEGLIEGSMEPLSTRDVSNIIQRGGTILGTSRSPAFRTREGRESAHANLVERGVEGLVVIGGNGSYLGASDLHRDFGVPVIGLPGTIDNDVRGTDYTIGFNTAVNTALESIDRIRDTAFSHDRAFFIEVMGRKSGAIALASGIAGGAEAVLIPERKEDLNAFCRMLGEMSQRGKRSLIVVVAEGDQTGGAHALAERVQRETGIEGRVTILGHIQRGGTPTAFDRILASRMGVSAIDALQDGEEHAMIGIRGGRMVVSPLDLATEADDLRIEELLRVCRELAH